MKQKKILIIIGLSFLHFICDLICGYKVISILGTQYFEYGLYIFITYNTIAFCFQPIIGIFIDKYHIEKIVLITSFIFLLLGLIFNYWLISAICLGIGNQIFHVAGGKMVSSLDNKKATPLGLFVSLGAIGLAVGGNFIKSEVLIYSFAIVYLLVSCLIFLMYKKELTVKKEETIDKEPIKYKVIATILIIIAVFIRSYLGKIMHFEFEMTRMLLLLLPISAAFGKFIGGVIRDAIGSLSTILMSMLIGGILLITFHDNVIIALIITVMINISMPITLWELNKLLPNHEGLNFGLLAAVLFPGVALGMQYKYQMITYIPLVIICVITTIYSIYYVKRKKAYD